MAEGDQWVLKEDGYLNVECETHKILYHPNLNVILVFTTANNVVKVLDVNSGVVLQSCSLKGESICDAITCVVLIVELTLKTFE